MELAKVIGTVVASVQTDGLQGVKFLIIQPQDASGAPDGAPLIAADAMQAGVGDVIAWVGGSEASLALPNSFVPVDAGVVAIVDHSWHEPTLCR